MPDHPYLVRPAGYRWELCRVWFDHRGRHYTVIATYASEQEAERKLRETVEGGGHTDRRPGDYAEVYRMRDVNGGRVNRWHQGD